MHMRQASIRSAGARAALAAALLVGLSPTAHAELEALHQILGNSDSSPVPRGWTLGAAAYAGSSPYSAGDTSKLAIPGGIYIGEQVMYLGDRIFYTPADQGPVKFFGRLRYRLGNLDPADSSEWTGLTHRKGQLEAGLGAFIVSPVGLWTARFSSDISGRSNGTELLFNWSAPIVGDRWMVMPSIGAMLRGRKMANYYFGGVSQAEAAPGRPAYDVGNAWSLIPNLVASYRIDRRWLVGAVLGYEKFSSAISDSPLIQKSGRYDVLVGVGYVWR